MTKREASEWVHMHLIVDELPFDDLVAAFTALAGRVPESADRPGGLFRRCCEMVAASTAVSERHDAAGTTRARRLSVA